MIPGSHVCRNPIHDVLLTHGDIPDALPDDHPVLQDAPGAVDVPAKAGSLVIADAQALHAARIGPISIARCCSASACWTSIGCAARCVNNAPAGMVSTRSRRRTGGPAPQVTRRDRWWWIDQRAVRNQRGTVSRANTAAAPRRRLR